MRRLRQEAGYTFDAFVEETGLGRGYLSELERGLVVPSLTALETLAAALGVTAADLVLGTSERERLFDRVRRLGPTEVSRLVRLSEELAPPPGAPPGLPFEPLSEAAARRHRSGLPLVGLQASAGQWSAPQELATTSWVKVKLRVPSKRGLFVAQVVGRSMEPGVPDGAYCLFQRPWAHPRPGEAGLFVLWSSESEAVGRFTLKEYRPRHEETEAGDVLTGTLSARNPSHGPLRPSSLPEAPERAFARLVRVLP